MPDKKTNGRTSTAVSQKNNVYAVNEYYIDVSRRFKAAKFITAFILIVFILGMITANRDDITIEGLQYLIRYINLDTNVYSYESNFRKIAYSADSEISFGMFRNDFVIADSTSLNIYSISGLNILNESSFFSTPIIETSNRHLLIYDLGGNSYATYNTFSKLFGETLPYPISGAANSDSGLYAIVTKTPEYRSAVYVYDTNHRLISRILKDKMVMDISLKPDGSSILVVSAYNQDGDFNTEIMTSDPYSDSNVMLINLYNMMPLKAYYGEDGFTVLCDSKLLFYTNAGILKSEYSYGGDIPAYSLMTDSYTFIAFPENIVGDMHRILIFDSNGKQIAQKQLDGKIIKMQHIPQTDENDFYVLTSNSIVKLGITNEYNKVYPIQKNSIDLIAADKDTLFLCYPSYAVTVHVSDSFPEEIQNQTETAQ